jgi:hypothetical protein
MYKPKVLFLDFENSAGSQMAEAYLRYLAGDLFESFSAGINPSELSSVATLVMDNLRSCSGEPVAGCESQESFALFAPRRAFRVPQSHPFVPVERILKSKA